MPANFRTYEGQSRLLTAVIAAHPGLKLNYKEIAKYFGESTPDGIQFQFRQIKKDAENLRQGKEAASSSATSTPVKTPKTPKTPGGRTTKRPAPPASAGAGKATAGSHKKVKREVSDAETLAALTAEDLDMLAGHNNTAAPAAAQDHHTPTRARAHAHAQAQHHEPPALDLTQATSPEDDDDTLTPREDPTYSFAHAHAPPPSLGSDPWVSHHGGLHAGAGGGGQAYFSSFPKDEYEDDGEV